ncbi:MAG: TRAP transporter substrate-binding protein DctP [Nitratireductor sp.]|nr:TRAP transporter substrate-binding protein DctP [Nitratireductor sp.]
MFGVKHVICAAVLTIVFGVGTAFSETVNWRFNNNFPPTRPESAYIRDLAKNVAKFSNGDFKIDVIEGGGMNLKDADALRWMQTGTPEIAFVNVAFVARDAPAIAQLLIFGSVSNLDEYWRVIPEIKSALIDGFDKFNISVVGFIGLPFVEQSFFCRQPVKTLADLKGKKVRVGNLAQIKVFEALGVSAQTIPQEELYTALQTGVVDCALYPAKYAKFISLQEVTKYAVYTGFPYNPVPYVVMANKAKLARLSPENRAALDKAIAVLQEDSFKFEGGAEAEVAARKDLTETAGVTWFDDFSQEDVEAIREASNQVWGQLAEAAGPDALATHKMILGLLKGNE